MAKPRKPKDVEIEGNIKAYCVKCKQKNVKISDPVLTWTFMSKQNKYKPRVTGTHSKCGTTLTTFVNQEFVDDLGL
jgi:hypothetical protein